MNVEMTPLSVAQTVSHTFSNRSCLVKIPPEPKRDWAAWILTGHRMYVFVWLVLCIVGLYIIQAILWPEGRTPHTILEKIWSWGAFLWVSQLIPVVFGLLGIFIFKHPNHLDKVRPIPYLVSFRIVSRGTNVSALRKTIVRCIKEMSRCPLFPYVIEVVVDKLDNKHLPPPNKNLRYIIVPDNYQTPNRSQFKARALQYALEVSPLPDNAWLVHLDEESHITSSSIKGICLMIDEEERTGRLRIGQGPILYHRQWARHPFLTLADNIRTGDDLARFHFQHKIGATIFGLHGSYIVVRNDLEKSIGFDFGPEGSITEDAFWALVAMERGYRCRWVDGYIEEQSTQSLQDFIKQRRRWFQGLIKVVLHAPVSWTWRFPLGINVLMWSLTPFTILYTIGHLFYGFTINPILHFLANLSFAFFAILYIIGLKVNADEFQMRSWWRRVVWNTAQVVFIPIFNIMEALGVLGAILKPGAGFHVIKK